MFAEHIVGLQAEYGKLRSAKTPCCWGLDRPATGQAPFLDFRPWPLAGASAPRKYTCCAFRIKGTAVEPLDGR